ncbi:hypothetical protein EGW08_004894 [Elysia chlorotica]|uniref:Lipocalin/cytosolic fatty-acid binding domain-containing protein n=1 Tax=Elysia chlorotica TaxID=188477 RepID=A0A433U0N0_ELYCH|nr:hypothetical protein EGW08_004894 [Elysia chlorotica]
MDAGFGKWKVDMDRSQGVEEYALASGTPKEYCTKEVISKSVVTISMDGDEFVSKTEVPGMPAREIRFKIGVPFEYEAADGRKFKITTTYEDGKIVETVVTDKGEEAVTVREFIGDEIKATTTSMGKTSVQYMVKA